MPLIISESLRSAVVSSNCTQGIVTILLSSADLAKLDLSSLQLFTTDSGDLGKSQAVENPALACTQDTDVAVVAPGNCNSSQKLAVEDQEVVLDSSPRPLASKRYFADDDFSFQTPVILSPVTALPGGISFPVFKSKAVADAEKATGSEQSLNMEEIVAENQCESVVCIGDSTPSRQVKGEKSDDVSTSLHAQNDIGIRGLGRVRSEGLRPGTPLPSLVIPRSVSELTPEKAEATLREVSEETMIDLKASPAAKFLLQVMPWELAPSPVTSASTPASVPFLWEDIPGKPKPQVIPSPLPSLRLPPRLSSAPPPAVNSTKPMVNSTRSNAKNSSPSYPNNDHGHHRKNTHSWHVLQNLFASHSRHFSHEEVTSSDSSFQNRDLTDFAEPQMHKGATSSTSQSGESSSFDLSSTTEAVAAVSTADSDAYDANLKLDYQLPSPSVATIVESTSPCLDLSPADDDHVKSSRKCAVAGSSIKFFANILRRRRDNKVATNERYRSPEQWEQVSGSTLPSPSNGYRTLRSGRRRKRRKGRAARVFCRLRRKGSRLLVAIYKAVKCALLVRRSDHSKFIDDTPLQHHMLQ